VRTHSVVTVQTRHGVRAWIPYGGALLGPWVRGPLVDRWWSADVPLTARLWPTRGLWCAVQELVYKPYSELIVDPLHALEGAKGCYGLDEEAAGAEGWARLQNQLLRFHEWYTSETNPERSTDALSAATLDGHMRSLTYFLGYAVRFHGRGGTMETIMDGALVQQYGAFLMARPCTPGTPGFTPPRNKRARRRAQL